MVSTMVAGFFLYTFVESDSGFDCLVREKECIYG